MIYFAREVGKSGRRAVYAPPLLRIPCYIYMYIWIGSSDDDEVAEGGNMMKYGR